MRQLQVVNVSVKNTQNVVQQIMLQPRFRRTTRQMYKQP